jgi:hypothetical protein
VGPDQAEQANSDNPPGGWVCPAYGPEGAEIGALCFFTDPGGRMCRTEDACGVFLAMERERLFGVLTERAAAGDVACKTVLEGDGAGLKPITSPEQLLGGPRAHEIAG